MLSTFITILPVFLVIGTGYLLARIGYLNLSIGEALNQFTVRLAVPAVLFKAMVHLDLGQAYQIKVLAGFYAGAVMAFLLGVFLARTVFGRTPGESVAAGFCAMFSNTLLLGLPIQERAYGTEALAPVFGIISLHAPLLYIFGMVAMELARAEGRPLGESLVIAGKSALTNTLMIGIMAGPALNASGLRLPEPVMAAVEMVARAGIPAALVGIGISLTRYRISSALPETLTVSFLSLILHPAVAFLISWGLFGLPVELVRAAVVTAAMAPGMNVYIFALMYDRSVGLSASSIVIATLLSVFTVTFWIWLLGEVPY